MEVIYPSASKKSSIPLLENPVMPYVQQMTCRRMFILLMTNHNQPCCHQTHNQVQISACYSWTGTTTTQEEMPYKLKTTRILLIYKGKTWEMCRNRCTRLEFINTGESLLQILNLMYQLVQLKVALMAYLLIETQTLQQLIIIREIQIKITTNINTEHQMRFNKVEILQVPWHYGEEKIQRPGKEEYWSRFIQCNLYTNYSTIFPETAQMTLYQ